MSHIDQHSATWKMVEDHAERRISELRLEIEEMGLDQRRSDELRGAIEECKKVLGLIETKEPIESVGGVASGVSV